MATLDGTNIFGVCVRMNRSNMPREAQRAATGGVSGMESTDLGLRGRQTHVRGRLIADTPNDLGSLIGDFESFMDGQTHTLFDQLGITWPNVMVETFSPDPDSFRTDPYYGYTCTYAATLLHLT